MADVARFDLGAAHESYYRVMVAILEDGDGKGVESDSPGQPGIIEK
jgi:hypothetical protein